MDHRRLCAAAAAVALLLIGSVEARDPGARADFIRSNPCPATGERRSPCPGYVVDHVEPLCAGGLDSPINMQWQSVEEAKIKDRLERQLCLRKKRSSG